MGSPTGCLIKYAKSNQLTLKPQMSQIPQMKIRSEPFYLRPSATSAVDNMFSP